MILQLLFLIFIILVAFIILLLLKPLQIYFNFKNNNFEYCGELVITYSPIQLHLNIKTRDIKIILQIRNKSLLNFKLNLNDNKNNKDNQEKEYLDNKEISEDCDETHKDEQKQDNINKKTKEELLNLIHEWYDLISDASQDLLGLIKPVSKIIVFDEANISINLGLGNNNTTIKLCSKIWAVSAILLPLGINIVLTPQINESILRSDLEISLKISLVNVLRLIIIIVTTRSLRNLIKKVLDDYNV